MNETPNLNLPFIMPAQAQKHVTHNEAIRALDAVVQLAVLDRDLAAPPAVPTEGQRYIVATSPTGPWAGRTGQIAAWQDGAWSFFQPKEGWLAWVGDEDKVCAFDGSGWVLAGSGGSVNPTPLVGVDTTADASNRLAVASPASLFTHAGAGHQLKINKAAAADTASQLFQTNFSGRAELGLMGDDNFRFKVSPDGAAWTEAILIDKATGLVTLTPKSVSNAALADMTSAKFKGRATAGSGAPEDLTAAQATALLDPFQPSGAGSKRGLVPDPGSTAGTTKFLREDGTWQSPPGAGEANTAANVGTAGVGFFKQKTGVNLEFKKINAGSSKVTVTDDTANSEVDLDVVEANLTLANLGGSIDLGGAKASGTLAAARFPALTGDVTTTASAVATTIANDAVSNAKLGNVGVNTIKGRISAGTGDPEDLTAAQARTLLNVADGANNYVHPNHSGDVTSVGDGATTIAADAVTNAKLANMATATFKGRTTAGTGDPEDLTTGQATALLNNVAGDAGSGGAKGLVPAPAAGDAAAGRFLKADGTWSAPAGGGGGSPGGSDTQVQFNDAGAFFGNGGMTYAKATQKLTLTSQDTLFNHNGASRQLQINKSAPGDNASILFQTAFAGRAEFGLTGDDDFHLKVSADGSAFNEAWIINRTTAEVSVRKALAIEEQTSAPATPATGLKTWARKLAGRRFAYVAEPSGEAWPLQSHIGRQRVARWNPIGNATTAPATDGIAAPTATGTATARNVATTNMATAARRLGYVSASTAGSLSGIRTGAGQYWRGNATGLGGFLFICRFITSDAASVSGARAFVGLSADTAAPTNVEPNTINNSVGVAVLSTSGNLQIFTRDGTTAQTIDLGASFPGNSLSADLYELMLYAPPNGTTIDYRVERLNSGNVAEGTLTTNLPVGTALLNPKLWRCNNATALAVGIDLVQLYIETSY
jgi:hypothetical protein